MMNPVRMNITEYTLEEVLEDVLEEVLGRSTVPGEGTQQY